jgi:hypothetical protein
VLERGSARIWKLRAFDLDGEQRQLALPAGEALGQREVPHERHPLRPLAGRGARAFARGGTLVFSCVRKVPHTALTWDIAACARVRTIKLMGGGWRPGALRCEWS